MQLINSNTSVVTNTQNAVQFGISKNSTKLFSMLSTSLYSNKELAVLYEIGANCNDAHALNGNKDKPWKLVMPTSLDPNIRFRDYGPGLIEEDVYNLLTTYGESTKANSNDFIGAYGIGSKSPAAVTSSWSVISRIDGILKEYLVFIDPAGIPTLSKLREEETSETGIEVIIPVNPRRFHIWASQLEIAFRYYDVKPTIVNASVNYSTKKPCSSGTGWVMYNTDYYYAKCRFITTQREYNCDKQAILSELKSKDFVFLLNKDMTIEFPTGSLETSLSRESLQYTRHTLNSIKTRLTEIYDELQSQVVAIISPAKDGLHYRELVIEAAEKIFGSASHFDNVLHFDKNNKFGVTAKSMHTFDVQIIDSQQEFRVYNGASSVSALTNHSTCFKTRIIGASFSRVNTLLSGTISFKIGHLNKCGIIINDDGKAIRKAKHHLVGKYVLIATSNVFPPELQRLVVLSSTLSLPKLPQVKREKRPKQEYNVWSFGVSAFWKTNYKEITDGHGSNVCLYCTFTDYRSQNSIDATSGVLARFLKNKMPIYGIKAGDKIPPNFKDIKDYANEEIARLNVPDFVDKYVGASNYSSFEYSYDTSIMLLKNSQVTTKHASIWNQMKGVIEQNRALSSTASKTTQTYDYLNRLCDIMGVSLQNSTVKILTVDEVKNTMYSAYKMLKYISKPSLDDSVLIEYLNQVGN